MKRTNIILFVMWMSLTFTPGHSLAQESQPPLTARETVSAESSPWKFQLDLHVDYRFRYGYQDGYFVDYLGTWMDQYNVGKTRLRFTPGFKLGQWMIMYAQADFLSGFLFGNTTSIGKD